MGITKTNTNSSIIMTRIITGTIRVNMFEVIIRYTVIVRRMLLDIGSGLVSYDLSNLQADPVEGSKILDDGLGFLYTFGALVS